VPDDVLQVAFQHTGLLNLRGVSASRVKRLLDVLPLARIALLEKVDSECSKGKDTRSGSVGLRTSPVAGEGFVVD
jgi:hypothetical protein